MYTAQGGIWSAGAAITTDGTSLYVATGNGAFNAAGFPIDHNYGDSLVKLQVDTTSTPTAQTGNGWGLKVADYFEPSNAYALDVKDLDLGSSAPTLLPASITDAAGDPLLILGGKESRIYVLDVDNLGKFNTADPETGNPDPRPYDRVVNEYEGDGIDTGSQGVYSSDAYLDRLVYVGQSNPAGLAFSAAALATGQTPTPLQSSPADAFPEPT